MDTPKADLSYILTRAEFTWVQATAAEGRIDKAEVLRSAVGSGAVCGRWLFRYAIRLVCRMCTFWAGCLAVSEWEAMEDQEHPHDVALFAVKSTCS